jgi:TRAP-type mannitol/chloroaromatic compound transport system permease small subunit
MANEYVRKRMVLNNLNKKIVLFILIRGTIFVYLERTLVIYFVNLPYIRTKIV